MQRKVIQHGLCSTLLLMAASASYADQKQAQNEAQLVKSSSTTIPDQGYRFHASLGSGFGSVMGGQYQSSPTGTTTIGSLGVGRRTRRWEWDTNLGWGYSPRSGLDSLGRPVSIKIRSARADLSARFRLTNFFQVGPILASNFGTDTRFNTSVGDSIPTFYGGAKALLDVGNVGIFPLQAWAEALTEVSSFGRDALNLIAGVRLSLPIQERRVDVISLSQAAPRRDVRVVLDNKKVFFKTSSSKIKPEIQAALAKVANHLAKNANDWDSIEISGHADIRGSKEYNDRLSLQRAINVQKELTYSGFDQRRVSVEAFGFSKPADPSDGPNAWAQNRRVELTFRNVANATALEELLAPLNPAYSNKKN
ncbi:MAG: OmpA family protein [Bdellovibrionales bacterium]|nr:OmpA family protein [Bdellovibrionales bacterium]